MFAEDSRLSRSRWDGRGAVELADQPAGAWEVPALVVRRFPAGSSRIKDVTQWKVRPAGLAVRPRCALIGPEALRLDARGQARFQALRVLRTH